MPDPTPDVTGLQPVDLDDVFRALSRATRRAATPAELAGEEAARAMFRKVRDPIGRPRPRARHRRLAVRIVVAAGAMTMASATAAAATGRLPAPAQDAAARVFAQIGIVVPGGQRGDPPPSPANEPATTSLGAPSVPPSEATRDLPATTQVPAPPTPSAPAVDATTASAAPAASSASPTGATGATVTTTVPPPPAHRPTSVPVGPPESVPAGPPASRPVGPPVSRPSWPPTSVPADRGSSASHPSIPGPHSTTSRSSHTP